MNPNLPVGGSAFDQGGASLAALPEDITQLALTLRYGLFNTEQQGLERLANDAGQGVQSGIVALAVRHHFGSGLSGDLSVPAGTLRFDPGSGQPERYFSGLGDVQLTGRYELAALWGAGGYSPSLVVELGGGLPTGTQARSADDGVVPPNILSVGRAAFSMSTRALFTQFVHKSIAITASAGAALPLTPTTLGVQGGLSVDASVGGVFRLADFLWLTTRVSGQHLEPSAEQLEGTILNSGGQWLAAEASTALRFHDNAMLILGARAPFVANVNGRQVSETASLFTAIAVTFGGVEEDEHDHGAEDEHDHADRSGPGDEHDHADHSGQRDEHGHGGDDHAEAATSDGDVRELAVGGATFRLADATVPGKVTVIDFWAEWCEPCHEVDAVLRELAAKHDDLAVRRVEVPTFDTPVARDHISTAAGLPVLWIFDRSGERVATLELGSIDEVRRAIAAALADAA